jgi:hypothetical protein
LEIWGSARCWKDRDIANVEERWVSRSLLCGEDSSLQVRRLGERTVCAAGEEEEHCVAELILVMSVTVVKRFRM